LDIYYLISIRGQFIIHLQAVFFPVDLRWSYWYMAWDIKQESSGYFLVVNTWWNYAQFWWWNWLLQTETAGASVICVNMLVKLTQAQGKVKIGLSVST